MRQEAAAADQSPNFETPNMTATLGDRTRTLNHNVAIVGGSLSAQGGGAPRSMASQANALATQGVKSTFFAGLSRRYPLTPDQLHISSEVVASQLWGPSVLGLAPRALHQLANRAEEFDFIHLNGAWNLTSFLGAAIAIRHHVPYIISGRSHYGEYHYSRFGALKPILYRLLEKYKIRHAAAIHVTSNWEEQTSRPLIGNARTVCIPNSVDLEDFKEHVSRIDARRQLGIALDSPLFVHLGRLGEQKNLSLLVRAFLEANPEGNAQLVLIGPPEGRTKTRLKRILQQSACERCVRFIDFAQGTERKLWLSAADLFVLPSWDENFCVAAIEAVACGTHCLLSPHVGAVEFLPKEGVTVAGLDHDTWAGHLREHCLKLRPQAFPSTSLLDQFSLDRVGELWTAAYAELSVEPSVP